METTQEVIAQVQSCQMEPMRHHGTSTQSKERKGGPSLMEFIEEGRFLQGSWCHSLKWAVWKRAAFQGGGRKTNN